MLGDGTIDGRVSANTILASNYQRPEDAEISKNAIGEEILNFATSTSSLFASTATLNLAVYLIPFI